jgi:hypothetical protein
MIVVFIALILVTSLASGPAWWNARRRGAWVAWDYASLGVPFGLWLGLVTIGFGPGKTLSNVVELFAIAAVVPIVHSVRVFFVDRRVGYRSRSSIIVFVVSNLVAIGFWALVPPLPE